MPHGYATAADVTSILTLQPGENVLFSVPVNHVAPVWFLQVAFQFDLPPWNMVPPSLFSMLDSIGTTSPKNLAGFQALDSSLSAVKTTVFQRQLI
jgi:hypothetical protein